jgi:transcription initiation factor TFIID TATA-box-binding protein
MVAKKTKKFTTQQLQERKYALTVQNVVCNFTVDEKIDLNLLVELLGGRYDPVVFPACVSSCKNSGTKNSFFQSGQVIIAGAKDYQHALRAAQIAVNKLRRDLGRPFRIYDFAVKNIVCSAHLGYAIDLDLFHQVRKADTSFDEEDFVGLTYVVKHKNEWQVTVSVFAQGAVVITGVRSPEQIPIIEDYLKIFRAFEQGKDYRKVSEQSRDQHYQTKEWRHWGLKDASELNLFNKEMKKKRKKQLKKKDKDILKIHIKKLAKKAEDEVFAEVKAHKRELMMAGLK